MADPTAMMNAAAELEALTPLPAPSQDVVEALRAQNAQQAQMIAQMARATEAAESALHQTQAAAAAERQQLSQAASGEVAKVRSEAAAAVKAARDQSALAEKTVVAAAHVRQATGMLAQFGMFLFDRAPVLLTLAGAYLLARNILPDPNAMQLGMLGIYGGTAVLPAVWLAMRRG